ncbi:MAG: alpha/beta hydrolase [Salinivirgaceae bacterium]
MIALQNNMKMYGNGRVISFTDVGLETSPVIIFIHGFPFNKLMWKKKVETLENDFRIIAYDILGTGTDDRNFTDYSIDFYITELLNLMDMLGIEKATLCGLSLGGYVAQCAIENYPARFVSILISDLNSDGNMFVTREDGKRAIENIRINGVNEFNDENLKMLFSSESLAINFKEIATAWKMIVKSAAQWHFNSIQDNAFPRSGFKKHRETIIV